MKGRRPYKRMRIEDEEVVTVPVAPSDSATVEGLRQALQAGVPGPAAADVEGECAAEVAGECAAEVVTDEVGYVTEEAETAHTQAVAKLDADIKLTVANEQPPARLATFQAEQWAPYVKRWFTWVEENQGFFSRFKDGEFQQLRAGYEGLRQSWMKLGQKTDAPSVTEGAPSQIADAIGAATQFIVAMGIVAAGAYLLKMKSRR